MILSKTNNHKYAYLVIIAYIFYGLAFIWNSSYEINDHRYFSLLDDAMVSMRYADHLADGTGPYFNDNKERVEGYSNPLWMLMMSIVHLTPISKNLSSLVVQLIGLVLLSANLFFVYLLGNRLLKTKINAIFAMLATALFLPLNLWGLGGMETSALALIVTASTYYLYKSYSDKKHNLYIIILPAIGSLIRPDFLILLVLFYYLSTSFLKVPDRKYEQNFGIVLFAVIFLVLSVRLYFYDDILPNTYYLKMMGYPVLLRLTNGIASLVSMTPLLIIWYVSLYYLHKRGQNGLYNPIHIIIGIVLLYNIYIGGDAWDWWHGSNRFVSIVMPLIIITGIEFLLYSKINYDKNEKKYVKLFASSLVVLFIVYLNLFNSTSSLSEALLMSKPIHMRDNQKHTELAKSAEQIVPVNATVALATAGVIAYFLDRKIIDFLGKNDKTIAGIKGRVANGIQKYWSFSPGHNKWDYSYSIGEIRPDVVVQLWTNHEEALPYLSRQYKLEKSGDYYFFIKIAE